MQNTAIFKHIQLQLRARIHFWGINNGTCASLLIELQASGKREFNYLARSMRVRVRVRVRKKKVLKQETSKAGECHTSGMRHVTHTKAGLCYRYRRTFPISLLCYAHASGKWGSWRSLAVFLVGGRILSIITRVSPYPAPTDKHTIQNSPRLQPSLSAEPQTTDHTNYTDQTDQTT